MPVIFGPSGGTAQKMRYDSVIDPYLIPRAREHVQKQPSVPCIPQIQVKCLSRKEKAILEHDQEMLPFALNQSTFKMH